MTEIIYVLINEAMPGLVKIGKTCSDVEQRMKDLDNTTAPLPFQCFYAARVKAGLSIERTIHFIFGEQRVRKNREFFRVDPNRIRAAIELVAIEDVTPRQDVAEAEEDLEAVDEFNDRRPPFRFSMAQIPVGAELDFSRDENQKCRVVNDRQIEFEGQLTSLSSAALILLKRIGWTTNHKVQGPLYWLYNGEPLSERRLRLEDTLELRESETQKIEPIYRASCATIQASNLLEST